MNGNVSWVVVLRSCAERHNVDIDHKDCSEIADELVLRGKTIKEKDAELVELKRRDGERLEILIAKEEEIARLRDKVVVLEDLIKSANIRTGG
jgi:hypothetical protein